MRCPGCGDKISSSIQKRRKHICKNPLLNKNGDIE